MPDWRWTCPNSWCNWEFISAATSEARITEALADKVKCQKCGEFIRQPPKLVDPA